MYINISTRYRVCSEEGKDVLVLEPVLSMHNFNGCLAAIETCGDFSTLFLPFVTSTGGLAFAGRGPSTHSSLASEGTWDVTKV